MPKTSWVAVEHPAAAQAKREFHHDHDKAATSHSGGDDTVDESEANRVRSSRGNGNAHKGQLGKPVSLVEHHGSFHRMCSDVISNSDLHAETHDQSREGRPLF